MMRIARHGKGEHIYLVRFHYLPPGAWDTARQRRRTVSRVMSTKNRRR
jgi:hypothetical protein